MNKYFLLLLINTFVLASTETSEQTMFAFEPTDSWKRELYERISPYLIGTSTAPTDEDLAKLVVNADPVYIQTLKTEIINKKCESKYPLTMREIQNQETSLKEITLDDSSEKTEDSFKDFKREISGERTPLLSSRPGFWKDFCRHLCCFLSAPCIAISGFGFYLLYLHLEKSNH